MTIIDRIKSINNKDSVGNPETDPWHEQESRGVYDYPLPEIENSLQIGTQIADINPPEQQVEQIGPFIVSHSPDSHVNEYRQALDFLVPDGTPVLAAEDGWIVDFETDNTDFGGKDKIDKLNYITIQHKNGELTQYGHLKAGSIPSNVMKMINQAALISKGTQIALTGMTGQTDRPHLHFIVYEFKDDKKVGRKEIKYPNGWKSLKPRFLKK